MLAASCLFNMFRMLQHVALNRFPGAAALNDILFLSLGSEETSGIGQSCLGEFLLLVRAATPQTRCILVGLGVELQGPVARVQDTAQCKS